MKEKSLPSFLADVPPHPSATKKHRSRIQGQPAHIGLGARKPTARAETSSSHPSLIRTVTSIDHGGSSTTTYMVVASSGTDREGRGERAAAVRLGAQTVWCSPPAPAYATAMPWRWVALDGRHGRNRLVIIVRGSVLIWSANLNAHVVCYWLWLSEVGLRTPIEYGGREGGVPIVLLTRVKVHIWSAGQDSTRQTIYRSGCLHHDYWILKLTYPWPSSCLHFTGCAD